MRLYTDFATLDAVSNGQAQLIVGRGSQPSRFRSSASTWLITSSCSRKLDLLVRLLRERPVTWSGQFRSALEDRVREPAGSPRDTYRHGSASEAAPSRLCAPRASACRSCWRSSAGTPTGSRPTSISTSARSTSTDSRSCRSGCTHSGSSEPPMTRPSRCSGPTTRSSSSGRPASAVAAADLRAVPGRGRPRLDVRQLARHRRQPVRQGSCARSASTASTCTTPSDATYPTTSA